MANRVQIILEMLNRSDAAFAELQRDVKRTAVAVETMATRGASSMQRMQGHAHGAAGGIAGIGTGATAALGKLLVLELAITHIGRLLDRLVFSFNSTLETANLGIASAFMTGGQYIEETTGKALEGQQALSAAQADAARATEELQVANFLTIATLDQLIRAYQETLPVAMAKGFDTRQVKEFTVAMVQAGGAIGLSLDMLGEETRSILTGAINPRTSRIATVLGLRNEDIARFKGDAQGLFDFLMQKLSAYRVAGIESQKTWQGVWSNSLDIFNQVAAKVSEPLFEAVKAELQDVADSIVEIDQATGQIKWDPDFLQGLEDTKQGVAAIIAEFYRLGMLLDKVGGTLTTLGAVVTFGDWDAKFRKWNAKYQARYEESDRKLQELANRLAGLNSDGTPKKEGPRADYVPRPPAADDDEAAADKAAKKELDAKVKYFNEVERMRAEEDERQQEMAVKRLEGIKRIAEAERQAREEAIQAQLFEIDLAERERSISREEAARRRIELQRELLELQRQHLEQLNKIDDPASWYAQLDAINATRAALVELEDEMQRLTGTVGEGAVRGFRDFTETARTAFEDGQKLAGDAAAGMSDALDAGFFDAMKGRLQSAEAYWNMFTDVIFRSFSQILSQQAVVGILKMLNLSKEQNVAADATAVGTTTALTGAMAAQTGVVSSLTAAYWALAAAKAAAGVAGGGGGEGAAPVGDWGVGAESVATVAHTGGLVLHDGGPVRLVPRFHFGGLAADEVPAVLQTGERVLSRRQNRTFDKLAALLERAGSGAEGGGGTPPVIVNMNVAAMDARSFNGYVQQNREAIAQAVSGARGDNNPAARGR